MVVLHANKSVAHVYVFKLVIPRACSQQSSSTFSSFRKAWQEREERREGEKVRRDWSVRSIDSAVDRHEKVSRVCIYICVYIYICETVHICVSVHGSVCMCVFAHVRVCVCVGPSMYPTLCCMASFCETS
jgi:hypothetical protein